MEENYLIITKEQANILKGRYGRYSEIVPIVLPDGKYFVPEGCMNDFDLSDALLTLETMDDNKEIIIELPDVGKFVSGGTIYHYDPGFTIGYSEFVICRQSHTRMDYPPYETPALFTFTRTNSDTLEWIPNELVSLGWRRVYSGLTYEVIMAHMTQVDWTPLQTLGVLWKVYVDPSVIPDWVQPTGAQDAYKIGEQVKYQNAVWSSLINANVWSPTVYPAGWQWLYDI